MTRKKYFIVGIIVLLGLTALDLLSTLILTPDANHSYKAGKLNTMEILVNETKRWMVRL